MDAKGISIIMLVILAIGSLSPAIETQFFDSSSTAIVADEPIGTAIPEAEVKEMLGRLDGHFIKNEGQVPNHDVIFYAMGKPLSVGLTSSGVIFKLTDEHGIARGPRVDTHSPSYSICTFSVSFDRCNPVTPIGNQMLVQRTNYYLGSDPEGWLSDIPSYAEVFYENLYDGIDLRFYFKDDKIKYDFIVGPGADPSTIAMTYKGVESLAIDQTSGDLAIRTALETVFDVRPILFQGSEDDRETYVGDFHVTTDLNVRFVVPDSIDRTKGFVVDPGLIYSTYFGGSGEFDEAFDCDVDGEGNVYILGYTSSANFPITSDAFCQTIRGTGDMYFLKFDPTLSTLLFATFIGGSGSSDWAENPNDLVVDRQRGVYLHGFLETDDFPTTQDALSRRKLGGISDSFLMRFSFDGTLQYSTYYGGKGDENGRGLDLDDVGNVYLSGFTSSSDFPTTPGSYCETLAADRRDSDIYIMVLPPTLDTILFCTLFGGQENEGYTSLNVGMDGFVYCAGFSQSEDLVLPSLAYQREFAGEYDGLVFKMDMNLSRLLAGTFIGTPSEDFVDNIVVDSDSTVFYLADTNDEIGFDVTDDAFNKEREGHIDTVICVMDGNLSTMEFCSYVGGNDDDVATNLILDPSETRLIIGGNTDSSDLNITNGAYAAEFQDNRDLMLAVMDTETMELDYLSYIGGSGFDSIIGRGWGFGLTLNDDGDVVLVGYTTSSDFPTTSGAYQRVPPSGNGTIRDAFCLVFDPTAVSIPGPPIVQVVGGDGYVNLTWHLDVENYKISDYRIYKGESSRHLDNVTVWENTTFNDTNVVNGRYYYYQVAVNNSAGIGYRCDEVRVLPIGDPSPPTLDAWTGDGPVHLDWSQPSYTGGGEIKEYSVIRSTTTGDEGFTCVATLGNVTSWVDESVEYRTMYFYRVVAMNAMRNSDPSNQVSIRPYSPPSSPMWFKASPGNAQVFLGWNPPESLGGSDLLSYRIYRRTSNDTYHIVDHVLPGTESYVDDTVENGVTYEYFIIAITTDADGDESEHQFVRPIGPPTAPVNLTAMIGDRHVILNWEIPENNGSATIMRYHIFAGRSEEEMVEIDTVKFDLNYIHEDLTNGEIWYYAVSAETIHGEGPRCEPVIGRALGVPGVPIEIVTTGGVGFVNIEWSEPISTGGTEVDEFRVYRGLGPDDLSLIATTTSDINQFTDPDVINAILYYYAVSASNAVGESGLSTLSPGMSTGPPSSPVNLDVLVGEWNIVLNWNPPIRDGGSPVTGYIVFRGTDPSELEVIAETSTNPFHIDSSASPGTRYFYTVAAVNDAGEGGLSDLIDVRFLTKPGEPLDVSASLEDDSVVITWSPPSSLGGSTITGYILLRGHNNGSLSIYKDLGVLNSYKDSSIGEVDKYWYAVQAVNDLGPGRMSSTVSVAVDTGSSSDGGEGSSLVLLLLVMVIVGVFVIVTLMVIKRRMVKQAISRGAKDNDKRRVNKKTNASLEDDEGGVGDDE